MFLIYPVVVWEGKKRYGKVEKSEGRKLHGRN